MVDYRLLNENKMKNYLSYRSGCDVNKRDLQGCIDYFVEFADYINEVREGNKFIKEGASLEVEINKELYEVWVHYNFVWENGKEIALIDLDTKY